MSSRGRAQLELLGLVSSGTIAACGIAMIASFVIAEAGDHEAPAALLAPGFGAGVVGAIGLVRIPHPTASEINPTTGFGAVTLAWVAAATIGALPFLIAGTFDSPIDALFESMSGFTTTGATLIDQIEAQPDGILLWRSLTQWLGGVGIVLLVVAIAPVAKIGLQRVFYAEVTGITTDRLTPRISDTAKIIAGIYVALSMAAVAAYAIAGMSMFDALNHALTTMATGGFSTRTASIGAFDSQPIEAVSIVFMTLAGINFALYWRLVRRSGAGGQAAEAAGFILILLFSIVALVISLELAANVSSLGQGIRDATFTAVSVMTTTGFTTADFDSWNEFARLSLLGLMVIGASAGSTGGGMKVIRILLLSQAGWQELQRQSKPNAVRVLRLGGRPYSEAVRVAVLGFLLVYLLLFIVGTLGFAICGLDPESALSATAATLNNIGPGLGDVGAVENFAALPAGGRLLASFLMLAGRLEILTVLALVVAGIGAIRAS